jgi:hypothetical protein
MAPGANGWDDFFTTAAAEGLTTKRRYTPIRNEAGVITGYRPGGEATLKGKAQGAFDKVSEIVSGTDRISREDTLLTMLMRLDAMSTLDGLIDDLAQYGVVTDLGTKMQGFKTVGGKMVLDPVPGGLKSQVDAVKGYLKKLALDDAMIQFQRENGELINIVTPPKDMSAHDFEAYNTAWWLGHQWGLSSTKPEFVSVYWNGHEALVPEHVKREVMDAVSRIAPERFGHESNLLDTNAGLVAQAMNVISRYNPFTTTRMKTGMLVGNILMNAPYVAAMFIGNSFQAYSRLGISEAARATTAAAAELPIVIAAGSIGKTGAEVAGRVNTVMGRVTKGRVQHSMVGAVVSRMFRNGDYVPTADVFIDGAGRVWTADALAKAANDNGLNSSQLSADSMQNVAMDIKDTNPTYWNRMMGRVDKAKFWSYAPGGATTKEGVKAGLEATAGNLLQPINTAKWWQTTLTESIKAMDNYFRTHAFLDELAKHGSVEEAAAAARGAFFDYKEMSDFERGTFRKFVLFYSYMRKNLDLFYWTAVNHPSRIVGQFRLINGMHNNYLDSQEESGLSGTELDQKFAGDPMYRLDNPLQLRLPMYIRNEAMRAEAARMAGDTSVSAEERAAYSNKYPQTAFLAPPLGVVDAVNVLLLVPNFVSAMAGGDYAQVASDIPGRDVFSMLNPMLTTGLEAAIGRDLYTGRPLNESGTIPAWFVQGDRGYTGGMLVDKVFNARPVYGFDLSKSDRSTPGESGYFYAPSGAIGTRAWGVWSNVLQIPGAGRSMSTISIMDRSNMGPVEAAIQLANSVHSSVYNSSREADAGLTMGLWERYWGRHKAIEAASRAEGGEYGMLPPGVDTMEPRTGLSTFDEFAANFAITPKPVVAQRYKYYTKTLPDETRALEGMKNAAEKEDEWRRFEDQPTQDILPPQPAP